MREGKLYQAIIQLNGHEMNRLHRFILSPYFNRNDATINLFEWIKEDLKQDKKRKSQKNAYGRSALVKAINLMTGECENYKVIFYD